MKSASGYDLTRLIVGSEGTLGVITEITLKIVPKPTSVRTSLAAFANLEDASRSFLDIIHSGIVPSILEVLDGHTIRVLRETGGMDLPDAMAMILVETDGHTEEEASFQMAKVTEAFRKHYVLEIRVAASLPESRTVVENPEIGGDGCGPSPSQQCFRGCHRTHLQRYRP
jgi:FAD/FMN-containing dehydrogenase